VLLQPSPSAGGCARFDEWAATPNSEGFVSDLPPIRPADLALLIYTSGTTGRPKAVPLTHGNIAAQIDAAEKVMKVTDKEVVLSILPLFHAYSQIANLWLAATVGARVVYFNQLGSAQIADGLKRCGATTLIGVPRLWYLFYEKIFAAVNTKPIPVRWLFRVMLTVNGFLRDRAGFNAGAVFFRRVHQTFGGKLRLTVSAGATFDQAVARDFYRLGFTILQGYGLTETSGAVTATRFEDYVIGSVGTPLDGVEVKINDPDEAGVGEVFIRGAAVTTGYYHDGEATAEAFTPNGWFRSGDLGRFDRRGHLYIVGRKKDVIVLPSGKNVFPEDVESHYERSPLVSEICVLGRRDTTSKFEGAESLCAVVVPNFEFLRAQHIANPGERIFWELEDLGRELPEYQRVHDFLIRTEPLPRTTTRKIRRFELRQELDAAGASGADGPNRHSPVLSRTNRELMDSPTGSTITAIIKELAADATVIHPAQNLEIDLRLDSLTRIECMTNVEQSLDIRFEPEEATSILTVGDLIELTSRKIRGEGHSGPVPPSAARTVATGAAPFTKPYWQESLNGTAEDIPALQPLLNRNRLAVFLAYLLLRLIYFGARFLLGMEVKGSSILKELKPPYLICPNHQSYIDPFLVCSVLPHDALKHILHVGASEYFTGFAMSQVARLINVVPIDPDAHLLHAMRAGAMALREGKILNVYPEGYRSFDGQLGIFKKGAAILATELNVPIVPVALDGTYRIWPRGSSRIRLAKVTIRFGQPIETCKVASSNINADERYKEVTALIRERISQMLKEIREH
jgi:long-chain acyl-CoA synthetase